MLEQEPEVLRISAAEETKYLQRMAEKNRYLQQFQDKWLVDFDLAAEADRDVAEALESLVAHAREYTHTLAVYENMNVKLAKRSISDTEWNRRAQMAFVAYKKTHDLVVWAVNHFVAVMTDTGNDIEFAKTFELQGNNRPARQKFALIFTFKRLIERQQLSIKKGTI